MLIRILSLAIFVSQVWGQSTLVAKFDMKGLTGRITFTQAEVGSDVTINLDLQGISPDTYLLKLHEYRVNYDTADLCSTASIGNVGKDIGSTQVTSGQGQLTVGGMDLSGTRSIEGRSLSLTGGVLKACSTIEADAAYITAFAHLPANLGGTVIFRQQEGSANSDTMIYTTLYFVGTQKPTTALKWQINSGMVKMDTVATTDVVNRCGTVGDLYNPTASAGTGCSTTDHSACAIGSLSDKHGDISVALSGNTKAFFGDLSLPLSGTNSIIGKSVVFMSGSTPFACANIIEYPSMRSAAIFSNDGFNGSVSFSQTSPLDPVSIHVDVTDAKKRGGRFEINDWPVPQKMAMSQQVCDESSVGQTFNPFNVDSIANYPIPATTTPDRYQVGDLSGKFGSLNFKSLTNMTMIDSNLQLFGANSITGRSIVVFDNQNNRWVCSTIRSSMKLTMAVVKFTYPVIGYMIFRQPYEMWYGPTQIYGELDYGTATGPTVAHNWHVHVDPVVNDSLVNSDRCQSVKGHYNPYTVDLGSSGDYATQCNPSNPFRCEVGDLSKKHDKINIRTTTSASSTKYKFFYTDLQLPLYGPQSIIGRSVTIHAANSGSGRLACADIVEQKEIEYVVDSWTPASGQAVPSGSITFKQLCSDILACDAMINVELSSLGDVKGYHVHQYPTTSDVGASNFCTARDAGGHWNPLGAPYPGPPSGTNDEYEIGDLSGKFGPLASGSFSSNMNDHNLPLQGPLSISRRSVVIHKDGGARWACGNLKETKGKLVEAMATFTGDYIGYVKLYQMEYPDGSKSTTSILVDLSNKDGTITAGHNWHVHEKRKSSGDNTCQSCKGHYNPFMVDMGSAYSECGLSNPLRCEVGDQSNKLGRYDIGSGKAFFTDVNLDVEGQYSAAKRSFVFHESNAGAPRLACANILPTGSSSKYHDNYGFLTVVYTSEELESTLASALSVQENDILTVEKSSDSTCVKVTVYFLGRNKDNIYNSFVDLINSGNYQNFGRFKPSRTCQTSSAGFAEKSLSVMLMSLVVALFGRRR